MGSRLARRHPRDQARVAGRRFHITDVVNVKHRSSGGRSLTGRSHPNRDRGAAPPVKPTSGTGTFVSLLPTAPGPPHVAGAPETAVE